MAKNTAVKNKDERLLSVEQTAERLGLRPNTVRIYLRAGRIGGVKIGTRWRVRESDLLRYMGEGLA